MSVNGNILGIDGGGTATTALVTTGMLDIMAMESFGPGNVRLLTDDGLRTLFQEIRKFSPNPDRIGIGMAGAREEKDRRRIAAALYEVWPGVPHTVTHDLGIALVAGATSLPAVLVLSGTGSCCLGMRRDGSESKVGGWGHLLGDRGSGYDIGIKGVRSAIYAYDRFATWGELGFSLNRLLLLSNPEELIDWAARSDKAEIARACVAVFEAAAAGDKQAKRILKEAAESLANDASICADRIANKREAVEFVFAGSVLLKQPDFAASVKRRIRSVHSNSVVHPLCRPAAVGAAKLALDLPANMSPAGTVTSAPSFYVPHFVPEDSPTEQRNPRSECLDQMSLRDSIKLMLDEEGAVAACVQKEAEGIEKIVRICARALKKGGHILYVGAGTSGRLGVLDASECPPTFRTPPEMVQGIIAGGHRALWQAVEGAEDDAAAGAQCVRLRCVCANDVVIGIAASGRTPFVWGALAAARNAGAKSALICFNPALKIARDQSPDVVIAPNLGPEVLTGSTRLKCGTATKLILNLISTLSMVHLGKVRSNLMVDLNPSNVKLKDRAERIVCELSHVPVDEARAALQKSGWVVTVALALLKRKRR